MLIALFWALAATLAASPPLLTFDDVAARARPGLASRDVDVELAELDHLLRRGRGVLLEGPTFATALGRRRGAEPPDGRSETSTDVALEADAPLRGGRQIATRLEAERDAARDLLRAAARLEDHRALLAAYSEAYSAARRLELRREDARLLADLRTLTAELIDAGAQAPFEIEVVAAEESSARWAQAAAEADAVRAWAAVVALADLPLVPLPALEPPSLTPIEVDFEASLLARAATLRHGLQALRDDLELAAAQSRWGLQAQAAREGDEDVVAFGVRWKMPLPGERQAAGAERTAGRAAADERLRRTLEELRRRAEASRALLETLPDDGALELPAFATTLRALEARVREGKERPSEALATRRALIAARLAAIDHQATRFSALAELFTLSREIWP
jgi:outer membrane protein TolC